LKDPFLSVLLNDNGAANGRLLAGCRIRGGEQQDHPRHDGELDCSMVEHEEPFRIGATDPIF
jgi:hypothetical protein